MPNAPSTIQVAKKTHDMPYSDNEGNEASLENNHNIMFSDSMPNAPSAYRAAKKSLIMIYSDNEEELESQDGNISDDGPVNFEV
jgi:hypothetical protein